MPLPPIPNPMSRLATLEAGVKLRSATARVLGPLRPWSMFCTALAWPMDPAAAQRRIANNVAFFRANYIALATAVLAWLTWRRPAILVAAVMITVMWWVGMATLPVPCRWRALTLTRPRRLAILSLATVLVLAACSVLVRLATTAAVIAFIVTVHAALRPFRPLAMADAAALADSGGFTFIKSVGGLVSATTADAVAAATTTVAGSGPVMVPALSRRGQGGVLAPARGSRAEGVDDLEGDTTCHHGPGEDGEPPDTASSSTVAGEFVDVPWGSDGALTATAPAFKRQGSGVDGRGLTTLANGKPLPRPAHVKDS